jgi:hypothetical protein
MQLHQSKIALTIATVACVLIQLRAQSQQLVAAPQQLAAAQVSAPGPIIREIDDPSAGRRWLLVRDPAHPGGPGRLLLVSGSRAAAPMPRSRVAGAQSPLSPPAASSPQAPGDSAFMSAPKSVPLSAPMIHAGDALVVEENTPVVDARLTATALGPAAGGAGFNARLTLGGRIVRVLALAPGRAVFPGAQP